jgi:Spy/CpxP family protein refolding chaperone
LPGFGVDANVASGMVRRGARVDNTVRKQAVWGSRNPFSTPMGMSRKLFICLALSLLAVASAQGAESQRSRWWKDDRIVRELGLTAEQSTRIEEIFQAALPALRAQQRALSKLEDELEALVQEAKVEESELEHFVVKVEAARAELAKTRTMMIYRMRRVLTAEQHAALQKIFERRERERRGRGRGEP